MSIRKGNLVIAGSGGSGSGSAMNVDDITTTLNANDEIQAIGVIEKNDSSVKYDWVGTESEWIAGRSNGSIEDDWICYIIDDNVASNKRQRTIGEIVYSLFPLTDVTLHLLDGSVIDGTGVYNQFYTFMKNLYDNGYDKCFTTEADWQSSVTTYDVCGKFVLDTENQTIRLPLVDGFIEGTLVEDEIGDVIAAGLPNITGETRIYTEYNLNNTDFVNRNKGAFYYDMSNDSTTAMGTSTNMATGTYDAIRQIPFDASRSNQIYGNSTTVQPQAIKGFYYIVLATDVDLTLSADTDAIINDVTNLQTEVGGADYVVEYQRPTSENNYRWYRLYKSGWIEQGGKMTITYTANTNTSIPITFLKQMSDTGYTIMLTSSDRSSVHNSNWTYLEGSQTVSGFDGRTYTTGITTTATAYWEVKGFAASGS